MQVLWREESAQLQHDRLFRLDLNHVQRDFDEYTYIERVLLKGLWSRDEMWRLPYNLFRKFDHSSSDYWSLPKIGRNPPTGSILECRYRRGNSPYREVHLPNNYCGLWSLEKSERLQAMSCSLRADGWRRQKRRICFKFLPSLRLIMTVILMHFTISITNLWKKGNVSGTFIGCLSIRKLAHMAELANPLSRE